MDVWNYKPKHRREYVAYSTTPEGSRSSHNPASYNETKPSSTNTRKGLPIVSESAPMRLIDSSGRRLVTTTCTTVTSTAITTTTTQTTTTNFLLPMLSGVQGILEKVAEYAAVVVGEELRHTRNLSPALRAVPWHLHDSR